MKYVAPSFALKDMSVIPKLHQITPDQYECNYWWFEYKNSGLYPEADNLTLEWVGVIPGKRESRRYEGLYMLT